MHPPTWVKAILRCRLHGRESTFCVNVDREVPEPIRCRPQGGAAGGGTPTGCTCSSGLTGADLTRMAVEAVRRGWGHWITLGAVVLEC
jgi:hypothetical protein